MPRLNYGTLLENVVSLEVARLGFDRSADDEALAFATAFAMPPLTQCWARSMTEQNNSPAFNNAFLSQLAAGQNTPQSLREAWAICISNTPAVPVCRLRVAQPDNCLYNSGGPNGALLAAMLAAQRTREIHVWVNDDGGRYGEVPLALPSSQSEVPNTLARGAVLVGAQANGTAMYEPGMFPGTIPGLQAWLAQGAGNTTTVRVGFLDPDNYAEGQTQVTRDQHQRWLHILANNCERTFSAMFFSCHNRGTGNAARNQRLAWFHDDEVGLYPRSLVFEYGNHQTGVKIRWPADLIGQVAAELRRRIQAAWHEWSPQLGALTVHEDGQPG
jgi:hypothetical protein